MAMVRLCYKVPSKELLSTPTLTRHSEKGFKYGCIGLTESSGFPLASANTCKKWHAMYPIADISTKAKKTSLTNASGGVVCVRGTFCMHNVAELPVLRKLCNMTNHLGSFSKRTLQNEYLCHASKSSTSEGQIRLLESYLAKLKDDALQDSSGEITELPYRSGEINAKKDLDSLEAYLGKLNEDTKSFIDNQTTKSNMVAAPFAVVKSSKRVDKGKQRSKDGGSRLEGRLAFQQNEETSYLYLISILVSVNIAVFLFEIASPIRNSEFDLFSLPLLYGAKINDLILVGEWWRLVTPMFLHSGLFHIALGCWALLTFGPQACKNYGSFTTVLIYILGGISGNLISFLHTPEPTVGGTGPVFSIIGAWLVYQIQNKDVMAKDVSEKMFQKAIIATALSFTLSNFGPVDNWTHLGAAITGVAYGFLTCPRPIVQVDDASSSNSQEEGITLVKQYANPRKSLAMFTIFLIVLCSLLFIFEPPLDTLPPI